MKHATLFDDYRNIYSRQWPWPHFHPVEMADSRDRSLLVVPDFMNWLEHVRVTFGQPMMVSSGYRTPKHNADVSGGREKGAHVDGMAADILVWGESALKLIRVASGMGVKGLGVSQTGDHGQRYLHLDMWTKAPEGRRPALWSY